MSLVAFLGATPADVLWRVGPAGAAAEERLRALVSVECGAAHMEGRYK